VRIDVTGRTGC